jgi:micrococcal nuclease
MALGVSFPAYAARTDSVMVRAVLTGDTVEIAGMGHVRLLGIRGPAGPINGHPAEPLAAAARDRLASLIGNRWVRLEFEQPITARRGRRSAYLFREDGVFVNARMLQEGWARVSTRTSLRRGQELALAQEQARGARRGIWAERLPPPESTYRLPAHPKKTTPKSPNRQRPHTTKIKMPPVRKGRASRPAGIGRSMCENVAKVRFACTAARTPKLKPDFIGNGSPRPPRNIHTG